MQSEFTYKFINKTFERYFPPSPLPNTTHTAIFYTFKAFFFCFASFKVYSKIVGSKKLAHDII